MKTATRPLTNLTIYKAEVLINTSTPFMHWTLTLLYGKRLKQVVNHHHHHRILCLLLLLTLAHDVLILAGATTENYLCMLAETVSRHLAISTLLIFKDHIIQTLHHYLHHRLHIIITRWIKAWSRAHYQDQQISWIRNSNLIIFTICISNNQGKTLLLIPPPPLTRTTKITLKTTVICSNGHLYGHMDKRLPLVDTTHPL